MIKPPKSWWSFCWKTRDNPCEYFTSLDEDHKKSCKFKCRGRCTNTGAVRKNWVNTTILRGIESI